MSSTPAVGTGSGSGTPVYRPACIMCVSDCDPESVLTNCQHFLCSRCFHKYPQGTCPRCQKPCQAVRLGASNFPRELLERITANPLKLMHHTMGATDFQRRQELLTIQRLRELVSTFNNSHREAVGQMQAMQKKMASMNQENMQLKSELSRLQLHQQQEAARARSMSMSAFHPQHLHQTSTEGVLNFGSPPGGAGPSSSSTGNPFAPSQHNHQDPATLGGPPQTGPPHRLQSLQSLRGRSEQHPHVPPFGSPEGSSSGAAGGTANATPAWQTVGSKRPREDAGGGGGPLVQSPPSVTSARFSGGGGRPHASPLRSLMDPAREDRFRLATPAVTLRGPPPPGLGTPDKLSLMPTEVMIPEKVSKQLQQRAATSSSTEGNKPHTTGGGALEPMLPAGPGGGAARLIHSSSGQSASFLKPQVQQQQSQ